MKKSNTIIEQSRAEQSRAEQSRAEQSSLGDVYVKIMRLDHWIKQFFILPGYACATFLTKPQFTRYSLFSFIIGFLATSLIASANYVINEYLDAKFDQYHPVKKYRSLVNKTVDGRIICLLWLALSIAGMSLGLLLNFSFFLMELWLWGMGILYNVKPARTKDIMILDVLSESVNNAIRFLLGWFILSPHILPPCSVILGYWMAGAFLMAAKRYAEYRMIGDPVIAGKYRKSFQFYTKRSLLVSILFYAMTSSFFTGVFLTKYRIELVLFMPMLIGLFCYYFWISFENDSAVQCPEKLYREKGLMLYCGILVLSFIILMLVDIPVLKNLTSNELIPLIGHD